VALGVIEVAAGERTRFIALGGGGNRVVRWAVAVVVSFAAGFAAGRLL
jgi:hypothetical protein